ncbi:hypothetical protein Tco_1521095, partial [Tanacetum coccineum]
AKEAEARDNVKLVEQHILDEDVNKLVEGDDSTVVKFADSLILSQEDADTRIDQGSHKERPEAMNVDDHNVVDDQLQELTVTHVSSSEVPPPSSSKRSKHINRVVAGISRRHHHMLQTIRQTFLHKREVKKLAGMVGQVIDDEISPMVRSCTNEVLEESLRQMKDEFSCMGNLYNEMKKSLEDQAIGLETWALLKVKFASSQDIPFDTCKPDAFRKCDHDDHFDDPLEGEKGSQRQKTTKGSSFANITSSSKSTKIHRLTNYVNNQIVWEKKEEYLTTQVPEKPTLVYQGYARDPNSPKRYLYNKDLFYLKHGNSEARKYVLLLHKIHATPFPKDGLEELLTR